MKSLLATLVGLFALSCLAADWTPSTPSRSLNSTFQPSTTRYVFGCYTVQIAATASLAGGNSGSVELRSDASTPPTTVRTSATNAFTITLGVGIGFTSTQKWSLCAIVPPGHYVLLATSGAATITLSNQTEWTQSPKFDGVDFATDFPFW